MAAMYDQEGRRTVSAVVTQQILQVCRLPVAVDGHMLAAGAPGSSCHMLFAGALKQCNMVMAGASIPVHMYRPVLVCGSTLSVFPINWVFSYPEGHLLNCHVSSGAGMIGQVNLAAWATMALGVC